MKALLLSISLALASAPALADAQICKPATSGEIAALFDRWNASLRTGSPEKVVDNYADHSVLLPTLSNVPRVTREQKADYFQHFLEKEPVGRIEQRAMVDVDCNTALDTGLYSFTFGDGSVAHARYTYTYKWDGERWLITSHHSSLLPENP